MNELLTKLNEEYKEWEIKSAVIGSELQAYFPHTDLPSRWGSLQIYSNSFSENVTAFYKLAALVSVRDSKNIDFVEDRQKLIEQEGDIIQLILNSDITSFNANPFRIFR